MTSAGRNGRNLVIEERFADGNFDRLPIAAKELVHLNVAVIVAANSPGARAAIAATKTIPIVMVEVGDPVATGFVTNLARPGGNVTGISNIAKDSLGSVWRFSRRRCHGRHGSP